MSENENNSGDDQSTYETPATTSEEAGTPSGPELAGRGRRLGAYLIDTIIAGIVLVAVAYFNPGPLGITMLDIMRDPTTQQMSTAGSIAFVIIFMAINSYLLVTKGQTLGKLALGIRIVDVKGGLSFDTRFMWVGIAVAGVFAGRFVLAARRQITRPQFKPGQ